MILSNCRLASVISFAILVLLPSVMSAQDIIWNDVTDSAAWSGRYSAASLVFDGKLWLFNGVDNNEAKADIWTTEDGINWNCGLVTVPFPMHGDMACIEYDDKIWVIGGLEGC